jgi:hypothetical protein
VLPKKSVMAVIFAIAIAPPSAKSDDKQVDVQQLLTDCKEPQNSWAGGFCLGYVAGVAHQVIWRSSTITEMKNIDDANYIAVTSACPKEVFSNGALVQVFVNWAIKHPERWSVPAETGVMDAIAGFWRC